MPNPFGPIGDKLHHVRIGGSEQSQIADEQGPNRLSVPYEDIVERQTQAIRLPMLVKDVDHQHAWLPPGGRKAVASLGRLTAAVCTPGAHASAIKTDTDPLAGQRAMGGDGQTQGCLQGGIAQPGARLSSGRGDPHEARHITAQAAPAEHVGGFEIAGGLYHVQGDLRAAGWADPIGNAEALEDRITACTTSPALASPPAPPPSSVLTQIGGLKDEAGPSQEQHAGGTQALV